MPGSDPNTETLEADDPGPDVLLGAVLDGRYELIARLGEGGMSVVYLARQDELDRQVAIKVLHGGDLDRTNRKRFEREARTAAALRHPNIVDVYDVGTLPDGRPYFVMPHVDGADLGQLLEDAGPQSVERVIELLQGPAAALDLVHSRGLVHRDIKPENIMVRKLDHGGELVQLLDFGAAAFADGRQRLTRTGVVIGTPHYISPEAATGRRVDARGDVYSFACVVFELLAGDVPFDDPSFIRLLANKVQKDAPALRDIGAGASVSAAVEAVVGRGLSRDPQARFASAGAMIVALREAAGQVPQPRVVEAELDVWTLHDHDEPSTALRATSGGLANVGTNLSESIRAVLAAIS